MGYFPIRVERSDGPLKTVYVQKTNDLGREASHETYTDQRGNRYKPDRFGVFVEIEDKNDEAPEKEPESPVEER